MRATFLSHSIGERAALVHACSKHQCIQPTRSFSSSMMASRPLPSVVNTTSTSRLPPLCATAGSSLGEGISEEEESVEEFEGFREKDRGYTPFEFIEFTNSPLKHEVSVWVDRPVSDCYQVWVNRLNWMQWFEMIDEVGFHEEQPSYISMYLWYRWATTPFLELYVTLERTQEEVNKYILEEPVEGIPLVAAVLFQEGDENQGTAAGTTVTLRLSYLLPKVLHEFAGQLAVYGDVDLKLQKSMVKMKAFVEGVQLEELEEVRKENEQQIRANFAEQRERKAGALKRREEKMKQWAAEAAAEVAEAEQAAADVDALAESLEADSKYEEAAAAAAARYEGAASPVGKKTQRSKPEGGAQANPAAAAAAAAGGGGVVKKKKRKTKAEMQAEEDQAEAQFLQGYQ